MKFRKKILVLVVAVVFVLSSFCTFEVKAANDQAQVLAYVKVASSLNVRNEPSTRNNKISVLKPGDIVSVKEEGKEWTKIELSDGKEGYVASQYIVIPDKDINDYELISAAVITSKSSKNRDFNLSKACQKINGLVFEPGSEFNWYGREGVEPVVGKANKANGFKLANIISGGKYVQGYGGGVCQVSTAVYNCINKLDIVPTEHHHHSLKSSYVEEGMDATVSYPNKNFVFENTKDYSIMFEAYSEKGQVVIAAYKVLN